MKYINKIYNLLVNEQESILELLEVMGVENPEEKIKNILDEQLFEVLECSEYTILKIRKKSTGEVFENGCRFYHKKYDRWIENMYFDESLFGTHYGENFYKNWVRGNGGLYHLNEISLTDEKVDIQPKTTDNKMKIIIEHKKTKREINGAFALCCNRQELEQLKTIIEQKLDEDFTYGWVYVDEQIVNPEETNFDLIKRQRQGANAVQVWD